jgi:hypothetical protein
MIISFLLLVPGKRKGPEDFPPGPLGGWCLFQKMKKPGVLSSPPSASGLVFLFATLDSDLYAGWTVEKRNRTKKKRRKR